MGFPHPTIDVPGDHPSVVALARRVLADPFGDRDELIDGCRDGAAAAGHVCATNWVLHPPSRRIVLVAHRELGWAACGGHVEAAEAPLQAAVRELREETALDAATLRALPAPLAVHRTVVGGDRPHTHWNLAFGWVAGDLAPLTGEPGAPARWFPAGALPERRPADVDALVAVLLNAAAPLSPAPRARPTGRGAPPGRGPTGR